MRGQWVELNPEEIRAALAFWDDRRARRRSRRARPCGWRSAMPSPPGSLDFAGVQASGWLADLLAQLEGASGFELLDPPEGFHGTLRPYQLRGYSWLGFLRRWGLGACLADDMGLGKTIQTLALDPARMGVDARPASASPRCSSARCPSSATGTRRPPGSRPTCP